MQNGLTVKPCNKYSLDKHPSYEQQSNPLYLLIKPASSMKCPPSLSATDYHSHRRKIVLDGQAA